MPSRFAARDLVTVRDGDVTGVRHRPAGSTAEVPAADKNFEYYWTVDGLFGLIAVGARARRASARAYDAALGFPREIYIDYDANFIGDELDLRLTPSPASTPRADEPRRARKPR